jgi:Flp pilus assembly protein TadG
VTPLNIKRLLPKRRTKNKGQGITEFALILPILLLVILGIIEAGWLIWAYITVQNAAREAARYAVTGAPLDDSGNPWVGDPIDDRLTGHCSGSP